MKAAPAHPGRHLPVLGGRAALALAALLLFAVAIAVAAIVIPAVADDTTPGLNRGPSLGAFSLHATFALASAALLFGAATGLPCGRWLWLPAGVAVLLALTLLDAAAEFGSHGPALEAATATMWAGAAAELLAAALTLYGAIRRE